MKKVYIAGKITGDPGFKAKFDKAKVLLEGKGFAVMTPADLPNGMKQGDYMRICLAMVDSADEVHVLPGSKDSKGTKIEVLYAQYIGKEVVLIGDEIYDEPRSINEALLQTNAENERKIFCLARGNICPGCDLGIEANMLFLSCQQFTEFHPDIALKIMRKAVE